MNNEIQALRAEVAELRADTFKIIHGLLDACNTLKARIVELEGDKVFVAYGVNGPNGIWATGVMHFGHFEAQAAENSSLVRLSRATSVEGAEKTAAIFGEQASDNVGNA